jgi:DNA-binding NtrC family response regulator
VRLTDPAVSRFHCELVADEDGFVVRDTGSTNGTRVDGTRVGEAWLRPGSLLGVGGSLLRFEPETARRGSTPLSSRTQLGGLVGRSPAMRAAFALLERAAASDATVLLAGETGTGKSETARAIHTESARRAGPFVTVDLAAMPASLIESELFGHERGAFTGAVERRAGAFEAASGGTVFLDEIGELPLELQAKLLGVLETRRVRRLGSPLDHPVDVRVIVATHRDLRAEVNRGRFRADLYFRLAVIQVALPALRQRAEDLPVLAERLLAGLGASPARIAALLDEELCARLASSAWPGNVRELRNYLERCLVFDEPQPLELAAGPGDEPLALDPALPLAEARQRVLARLERDYLAALLARHGGRVDEAALAAGVDRAYLYRLIKRHGVR